MRLRHKLAVVGVKMEFLEEWGFEMLLADEVARWWAAILLHPQPNCELVVSHHTSRKIHLHDQKVHAPTCVTLFTLQVCMCESHSSVRLAKYIYRKTCI